VQRAAVSARRDPIITDANAVYHQRNAISGNRHFVYVRDEQRYSVRPLAQSGGILKMPCFGSAAHRGAYEIVIEASR